jgi:CubicO group peptidase (beta-lactamase class C family)
VPGFVGYEVGAPLPTLTQILDGAPLANSPPVTVIAVPGSAYHYSGGGYEIAEALMADTLHAPFPEAMDALVLKPAQMMHSTAAAFRARGRGSERSLRRRKSAARRVAHLSRARRGGTVVHTVRPRQSPAPGCPRLAWRKPAVPIARGGAGDAEAPKRRGPTDSGRAVRDSDGSLIVMKRGQNVGYQGYLILLPTEGQGLVVMTNSDNGSILAEALIRRVAQLYRWPPIGVLPD